MILKISAYTMDWLAKPRPGPQRPPTNEAPMGESFYIKRKRIATALTEAQSHVVNYPEDGAFLKFRYRTDEKTIELPLSAAFLRRDYIVVRNYLDHCIRHFLAKKTII
ncbi:MAG TPA: hypothetical protein VIL74_08970 [Pyrinomonadaceae bacterium]